MSSRPAWAREGRNWPNRAASRFVRAAGLTWHVQMTGSGPVVLLVHGTGAATHSWRGVLPLLARRFTLLAPDLPGHGFTEPPPAYRQSLPGMARSLAALLAALDAQPALVVGHSAGAAILARMCLDGRIAPRALVSLGGAMLPMGGTAGHFFAPFARLLAGLPLLPALFAWRAGEPGAIERLLRDTGSTIEPAGIELYRGLARSPAHVGAALAMMAHWDLGPLARELKRLKPRLLLVHGDRDRTIPASDSDRVAALVPMAGVVRLPGLGHLAHEERPQEIATLLLRVAMEEGVLAPPVTRPLERNVSSG